MPAVQGFAHMAMSVVDAKRSADFYAKLLDGNVIDASDDISPFQVVIAGNVMVGFRAHRGIASGDRFDHNRVGLDHVAFMVASGDELEQWRARLDEQGITNSGIQTDPAGMHLNARDPDNIAIEFYVMPS